MPGTASATKQQDQMKEQEPKKEKETSFSCGIEKSSCCG